MNLLGPVFVAEGTETVALALEVGEDHLNHQGAMHGGMVATLADNAMGRLAARVRGGVVTVHLDVDYLSAVKPGSWLVVAARLRRPGRQLIFAECSGTVSGKAMFAAQAIFSALPGTQS